MQNRNKLKYFSIILFIVFNFFLNCHSITYSAKKIPSKYPVSYHRTNEIASGLFTVSNREYFIFLGLFPVNKNKTAEVIQKYLNRKTVNGKSIKAIQKVRIKSEMKFSDLVISTIGMFGIVLSSHTVYVEGEIVHEN